MKDTSCNIIEDLLPLYVDDVCSDETKKMIEDHIKYCSGCQQKFDQMKSDLPIDNIEDNIDDSKIISKLSDTWIKNTRLDAKTSIIIVLFYVFAIVALFVLQWLSQQAHQTFEIKYSIAHLGIRVIIGMLIGGLLAFLGSRPKRSKITFISELLIIGIPSILMLSSFILGYLMQNQVGVFIFRNAINLTIFGALLFGCEIFRILWQIRKGNRLT